jgi:hypothetical protein
LFEIDGTICLGNVLVTKGAKLLTFWLAQIAQAAPEDEITTHRMAALSGNIQIASIISFSSGRRQIWAMDGFRQLDSGGDGHRENSLNSLTDVRGGL